MLKRLSKKALGVAAYAALALAWAGAGICQTPQEPICVKRVVAMEYPPLAQNAVLQGNVVLEAEISDEGTVAHIKVVSGPPILATAAGDTLLRWRFAGCKGQDKACEIKVVFSFVLSGTCVVGSYCPTEFVADLPDRVEVKSKKWDGPIVN
jgi:TonB family protein